MATPRTHTKQSVIEFPIEKGAKGLEYRSLTFSHDSGSLDDISAVLSYCSEPLNNLDWNDLVALKRQMEVSTRRINTAKTFSTILELPKSTGLAKIRDWWLSRYAIVVGLKKQSTRNAIAKKLVISISHTSNMSVAVFSNMSRPIGVDIEPIDREMSDRVMARIRHPNDLDVANNLDCWVIKEAVFKASGASSLLEVAILEIRSDFEYVASVNNYSFRVLLGDVWRRYRIALAFPADSLVA